MIKVKSKKEAWKIICSCIACDLPAPVFAVDESIDACEMPINLLKCRHCGKHFGDTVEDLILENFAKDCSICGAPLRELLAIEMIVQGMKIICRRDT